jgi:RNA polymerase sigma-70 factor (ECF subfamily)
MIQPDARATWHTLHSKLRPFIARRVASAADADDVLQDLFLRMQRGLPSLREEERFGPWVYQVARSAIAEHQRQAARHPLHGARAPVEAALEPEPDQTAAERELVACLSLFVASLPAPYGEALTLTELEGRTQAEAAALLGLSLSGMKSRVQRGRAQLREAFEACCQIALDARGRVISCEPRPDGRMPNGCSDDESR